MGYLRLGRGRGQYEKHILTMHMTGIKLKKGTQLHDDVYDEQRRFNICGLVHYLYRIMKWEKKIFIQTSKKNVRHPGGRG